MKKVLFIAGTNLNNSPKGGEEYKNQLLFSYLNKKIDVKLIDTHNWKLKPWVLVKLLYFLFFVYYDKILISVTTHSANKLIRIISLVPSVLNRTIYMVIGGNLPQMIKNNQFKSVVYLNLKYVVVEGIKLKKELEVLGLKHNVIFIPNFKPIECLYKKKINNEDHKFRFVFISSMIPSKGVNLILEAVQKLLEYEKYSKSFIIDFYGPFELEQFKIEFMNKINKMSEVCTYKGYLDIKNNAHESYKLLSTYDCLLFPSTYYGEGFPGVVIDSFIAGLPVIISNWNMNTEIIQHGVNGLILEKNDGESLFKAMYYMMNNSNIVSEMRVFANKSAYNYEMISVLDRYFFPLLNSK